MKKLASFGTAAFLSALVSASALLCLNETFGMGCDTGTVLLLCGAAALLAALSMLPRRRWPLLAAEALLAALVVRWQWPLLAESFQRVLFRVTLRYSKDFRVEVLGDPYGNALWFLLVLGVLLAWITARVCSGKGSAIPVGLACLPVFVLCLLVVDIAPVLWLMLLTAALVLLVLTKNVRSRDPEQGSRLTGVLLLPVALLLAGLLLLWPPETYARAAWADRLLAEVELYFGPEKIQSGAPVITVGGWDSRVESVDLGEIGPQLRTGKPALEYRAESKISYLRGASLGVYEDNTWHAIDPDLFAAEGFRAQPLVSGTGSLKLLEVRTEGPEPLRYITYDLAAIPGDTAAVDDAYLANSGAAAEYAVSYSAFTRGTTAAYDAYVQLHYTQIPAALQEPLLQYLRKNGLEGKSAQAIAAHVKQMGVYDRNTARLPQGEDFVLYFLQESRQGYCVHFASATVMLLRAQGVPARYVSGYAVSGPSGTWNTVTEDDAHAWVEYYLEGVGWRPLDPTPADWQAQGAEPSDEPREPPAETLPEEETPPEETPPAVEPPPQTAPQPEEPPSVGLQESGLKQVQKALLRLLRWILLPLTAALLLVLRRTLMLRRRLARCTGQPPNSCMLAWWQWLVRLNRETGHTPGDPLLALAEKARFSQHTVSKEELALMQKAVEAEIAVLQKAPIKARLWHLFGPVLY